ncbi:VWA domain-containing protein [Desulfocicer niacini]
MDMKFAHPYMFYLIWIVILLAGVTIYGIRKRTRILSQFMSLSLVPDMAPGAASRRRWTKGGLLVSGFLLAVLALTGPLLGFRWEKVEQKGVDIMIALDCSRSMLATDIKPTRLERAKREIIDLLKMMQSDRAGLVAFSGSAILQCPLTLDHSAFSLFLKALSPDYLPMGGTDLSGAIATALNGFEWDTSSEKAIIIITDGENTSGDPMKMAREALEKDVRIFCIGVGKKEGAPIPDAAGGFKKDATGSIVMSRVDDEGLEKIAALTRGIYVKSVAGDMDLDLIYTGQILKNMERTTVQSGRKKVWENRFQWLLLPCVLLLILELLVSEKGKKDNGYSQSHLTLWLILCLAGYIGLGGIPLAHAGASKSVAQGIEAYDKGEWDKAEKSFIDAQLDRPDMPELYYNIGSAAYKRGDYGSAAVNFTRAMDTEDADLKQKATFNLGNTQYRKGNLEDALESFKKIPETSPLFQKSTENIEFVKQKIQEQKKAAQDQKSSNGDQKDDSKNSENKDSDNKDADKGEQQKQDQQKKNPQDNDQGRNDQGDKKPDSQPDGQNSADQKNEKSAPDQQPPNPGENQDTPSPTAGQDEKQKSEEDQATGAGADQKNQQSGQDKEKSGAAASQAAETQDTPEQSQGMGALQPLQQQMLDRLEDQPGRAMMPVYSGQRVEKDW